MSVAVDVGPHMGGRQCPSVLSLDKNASHLDLALATLTSIVNQKMMFKSRHLLGLTLFGTKGSYLPPLLKYFAHWTDHVCHCYRYT